MHNKNDMKKIYSANNLMEAQIVLDMLEHALIPAQLFNQHAQGGMGDIPFTHAYPEVWIMRDTDYERGRKIVQQYEAIPQPSSTVHCPACGEENPSNFQLCWQCGGGLETAISKSGTTFFSHENSQE